MKRFIAAAAISFVMLASVALAQTQVAPVGGEKAQATKEDILKLQLENVGLKFQVQGCGVLMQQAQALEAQIKALQSPAKPPEDKPSPATPPDKAAKKK